MEQCSPTKSPQHFHNSAILYGSDVKSGALHDLGRGEHCIRGVPSATSPNRCEVVVRRLDNSQQVQESLFHNK
jgi:hypothetical protein